MKMISILLVVLSISVSLSFAADDNANFPNWVYLECVKGHKYLFSEVERPWLEAREECELYGGWLVDIRSQAEANCLMRYGMSLGLGCPSGYWTDGNDIGLTGVWTH